MARPRGYLLSTPAFQFACEARMKSQAEVAVAAGKSPSFLSELRSGTYGASAATAKALCEVLMVDPAVLFPELAGFAAPDRAVA